MMFDLILLGIIWTVSIIFYLILTKYSDNKDNILIGAVISEELRQDDDLKKIMSEFYHSLKTITLIICIVPIPIIFINRMSIKISLLLLWLLISVNIQKIPWIKGFQQFQCLKEKKDFSSKYDASTFVDTNLADNSKLNDKSLLLYIPAVLISFIPVIYEMIHLSGNKDLTMYLVINGTFAVMTLILMMSSIAIRNTKNIIVSNVSAVNANYNRIRTYNLNKSFLILAWFNTVYTLITWIGLKQDNDNFFFWFFVISIIYIAIVLGILLWSSSRIRRLQNNLMENVGKSDIRQVNDDSHWIGGIIYNNPNDLHSKVYSRMGVGFTPNVATSSGKISFLIQTMIVMIIPFICGWMIINDFTPLKLIINNDAVIAEHIGVEYKINLDDIESVEIITGPLKNCFKLYGIGMDNLYKGYFRIRDYGRCNICLNPHLKTFLFIKTYDDDKFLFTGSKDEDTYYVYDKLKELK